MPEAATRSAVEANLSLWRRGSELGEYTNTVLRPVEALTLARFSADLRGRVLELGAGAGRFTTYLARLADEVVAIEISSEMIAHARRICPGVRFEEADLRDLDHHEGRSFTAVFAPCNVLDSLDDANRRKILNTISELLVPGGLFMMSSHNLAFLPKVPGPWHVRRRDPARLALDLTRIPRRVRNARRLKGLQSRGPDYAIVNDGAHDFSLLHYFIGRDAQVRQLADTGFDVVSCLTLDGDEVPPGHSAADEVELHYIARAHS